MKFNRQRAEMPLANSPIKNNEIIYKNTSIYPNIVPILGPFQQAKKKKKTQKTTSSVQNTREVTIGALSLYSTYNDHCAY